MTVPQALRTYRHDTDDRALITLAGDIDMESAPLIRETLASCLRDGIRTIDVDLTAVAFCDCSGVNAFLTAWALSAAAGASMRLHHPRPAVVRLMTLTGSQALLDERPGVQPGTGVRARCAA